MFKRGYKRGGLFVLFLISILGVIAQGITSSTRIGITNLNAIPNTVVDTLGYNLNFHVVNRDWQRAIIHPVSIYMKVDGGEMVPIVTNFQLPFPVAPGDSLNVSVQNFEFRPQYFLGGGGITHDIIVWPMAAGVQQTDSAKKNVQFDFTQVNRSQSISVTSPLDLPNQINAGQAYNFRITVINQDEVRNLAEPVSLWMSIDNDTPTSLVDAVYPDSPLAPGDFMQVDIDNYVFDAMRFSGGGITHDIIVWPMAAYVQDFEAGSKTVIFSGNISESIAEAAASTLEAKASGPTMTITWKTDFEKEGMQFELEKKNKNGFYKSIFVIGGSGSGEEGVFYQVEDIAPFVGINSYRMKVHFADGSTRFVKEFTGVWDDPYRSTPTLSVMANPFQDKLNLVITVPYSVNNVSTPNQSLAKGLIQVVNLEGKPVYSNTQVISRGKSEFNIDLTNKPEGFYFYQVYIGDQLFSGKVIKE